MRMTSLLKAAGLLVAFAVVLGLLFPAIPGPSERRSEAKSSVVQLNAALRQYYIEYGKWPDFTGDGLFLDGARNAQLMRTLCAQDEINNPRKIVFFEGRTARTSSAFNDRVVGGFQPETGAFLDTWGNPYHFILDADYDGIITNPYSEGDYPTIHTGVIVWSLGKDGKQGAPANPLSFRGSDDLLSWQ